MTEDQQMSLIEPPTADPNTPGMSAASEAKKKSFSRVHATQVLPSERFPFEAHLAVCSNAVVRSKFGVEPVDTEQIEDGLKVQSAVLNVNFLNDVGLLVKDKRKYLPTPECVKFVKLLRLDEARAKAVLREIIKAKWFTEAAVNYLSLHVTASEDTIVKELALASEVSDPELKARSLRILVDYMAWSGTITRDNGQIGLPADAAPGEHAPDAPLSPSSSVGSVPVAPSPARAAPAAQPLSALVPAPPAAASHPTWLRREWPDQFTLSVKPDLKAIRILEATVKELKAAMEIAQEAENS